MNHEKVEELMVQAGARFEFLHGIHYDDFDHFKFAELIVQECIDKIESYQIPCGNAQKSCPEHTKH